MPQSLANVLLHIIFSTKNRVPYLQKEDLRETTNAYFVGTLANLECPSLIVRTVSDHIHILCQLSRKITIATLLQEIKVDSSSWVKKQAASLSEFYWQSGYGAFSVSQSNVPAVKNYIATQEEHHREMSFQEEFRKILQRHEIDFDERYVWD